MKQTSILGFFHRKKPPTNVDQGGDTILIQKDNSNRNSVRKNLLIKNKTELKGVKRKLEASFLDENNDNDDDDDDDDIADKAEIKQFSYECSAPYFDDEDDDEAIHKLIELTRGCEILFQTSDLVLPSTENYENRSVELDIFKGDHSLLCFMIRKVISKHSSLFSDNDHYNLEKFLSLSSEAQTFYLKIFKRKRKWQRFVDAEFSKNDLSKLIKFDFFELSSEDHFESIEQIVDLLKVSEVQMACKKLNIVSSGTKKLLLKTILKSTTTQKTLSISPNKSNQSEITLNFFRKFATKKFFRLNNEKEFIFHKILLLFYNPYSYMANYVENFNYFWAFYIANNLLNASYEPETILYESSDEFDHFVKTVLSVQDFKRLLELPKNSAEINSEAIKEQTCKLFLQYCFQRDIDSEKVLPSFLKRFTSSAILFSGLSDIFMKCKSSNYVINNILQTETSISILQTLLEDQSNSRMNRLQLQLRLIRLYNQQSEDKSEKIKELLNNICEESHYSISGMYEILIMKICQKIFPKTKIFLDQYFPRYFKEESIHAKYRSVELEGGNKNSFYIEVDGQEHYLSVEDVARFHYFKTKGFTKSLHCEGSVYLILFNSLFENVLNSADIADSFRYYCQELPLDIKYSERFYSVRKKIIDSKIEDIQAMSNEKFIDFLRICLEKNSSSFQANFNIDDLLELAFCIGPKRMSLICETLLKNYCDYKKGFPDLLMWKPNSNLVSMVEVKGHRDCLSANQILWLNRLVDIGFDAICCHVSPLS